ncbi:MAG: isoprenylcysteine carboxyl methyltransferase [Pseudonocardiales bacterium]|nr:MAG: isoprenylcysteine carboxyl methyltransferase [Pseudonocardiales bacterium]
MRKQRAALGSALFFLAAPCVVAGVLPWWISRWNLPTLRSWSVLPAVAGAAVGLAGLVVLLRAFGRFVNEGLGTPAPVAPTERLVVGGDYRFVRNPMYVAVEAIVLGQALVFRSGGLMLYALVSWLGMAAFVRWYEEPVLRERFGAQYESYRRSVRAWWPRLHPWTAASGTDPTG